MTVFDYTLIMLSRAAEEGFPWSVSPAEAAALVAEVERLRQTLDATEKERDQWHDAALDRRQALHDADALRTGVYLALSPEGGVNGWRPSRGVDALIDLALTVREDAEEAERAWEALLAEVERLRAEVSYLRACVPPVHPTDYGHEAWAEAVRAAVAEERAAVVAWLRDVANAPETYVDEAIALRGASFAIERGEHRREEE